MFAKLQHRLLLSFKRLILRQKNSKLSALNTQADCSSSALLSLSSLLSEARYTLRLLGILTIWKEGADFIANPSNSRITNILDASQLASIAAYQLLENIAYLGSKDIFPQKWIKRLGGIENLYLWSIRGLLAHFVIQLVKLGRENLSRSKEGSQNKEPKTHIPERQETPEGGNDKFGSDDHDKGGMKDFVSSSLWTLLCIHWSFPHEVQTMEKLEGGLSFLADFFLLRDFWIEAST